MLNLLTHLDTFVLALIQDQGGVAYALLFFIVFAETGLIVFPMLPGDSLLFVIGAAAATGAIDILSIVLVLTTAAILGNWLNFTVGRWVGPHVFTSRASRWLNPVYLERTHAFFERHGGKTIVIARFLPIIRTYAPFTAGIGTMPVPKFHLYSTLGAIAWVSLFTGAGYLFGDLPIIKGRLSLITLGIVVVTVVPAIVGILRSRKSAP
jgi:membrane-associated protein